MIRTTSRFRIFLATAIASIGVGSACAQDTTSLDRRASFGVFAGIGLNQHSGSFEQLPGVPNCGTMFTNGFGIGPDLGILYKMPVADQIAVSLRGLYLSHGGTFNADEHIPLSVSGNLVTATDRHSLDATLGSFALQPVAEYEIVPRLSIYGGLQLSYILSASFTQSEQLTSPANGVFYENRLRTRNPQAGNIPDVQKFGAAILVGAGYSLPMNSSGTLHAVPQAYFALGLTPVVSGLDWHTTSFNAGVAVEFTPPKEIPPPPPPPPPPAPPQPQPAAPPPIAAHIRAFGLGDDGVETPGVAIVVEELYAKNLSPILPFVFFDTASSEIPSRMHLISREESKSFDINKVATSNALTTHWDMLNIIGSRLAAAPKATVTLTGIIHGNTSAQLVHKRAEKVRDYFTNSWGIDAKRFTIQSQVSNVATNNDSDIVAEEHRVEIQSNDPSLIDPLVTADTLRDAEPPSLRIYPSLTNIGRAQRWEITASQQGRTLASWSAKESAMPAHLDWRFTQTTMPKYPGTIDIVLRATDSLGRETSASTSIPVEQVTLGKKKSVQVAGKAIERYNLIVFDRGSSLLTAHHRRLNERIKNEIKPNSSVSVIGYTDRVGESNFNQRLSQDRASAVAKALGIGPKSEIKGIGETQDLYPNTLPEGRFFCRTVVVTIETEEKSP